MADLEIEMKARLVSRAIVEQHLRELGARHLGDYHKIDRYFSHSLSDGRRQDCRLRSDGPRHWLTFKDKTLVDGLEINREWETGLAEPAVLAELLQRLGAQEFVRKEKTGSAWDYRGLKVEVSTIALLGDFIEVELVLPEAGTDRSQASAQARQQILAIFDDLGIEAQAIESRTYTSMLLELQAKSGA